MKVDRIEGAFQDESSIHVTSRYIPEIDTLRAIAVLQVVGYHAYPDFLPGGFIGVDVFFVISGFVIARSYLFLLIEGKKSLSDFFVSRARRLIPAHLVMLLTVSLMAAILIEPAQLLKYGQSVLAQIFYIQNFLFWFEGDYFQGALTKPLLHTWSLAVEEQFYICFALAILFFRRAPGFLLGTIISLAALSLLVGVMLEARSPKTVFFMLPTRVWEFSVGILAYFATRRVPNLPGGLANAIAASCLVIVIVAGVAFESRSSFPGPQSYLAVLATSACLFVMAQRPGGLPAVFQVAALRYIGKVSYGYYLWHWPPLVLSYLYFGRAPGVLEATLLITLSFAVAVVSYHFLEAPVRSARLALRTSDLVRGVLVGVVSMATISLSFLFTDGLAFRYSEELRPFFVAPNQRGVYRCGKMHSLRHPYSEACPLSDAVDSNVKILVVGDSHADVLKHIVGEVAEEQSFESYLAVRNCEIGQFGRGSFCSDEVFQKLIDEAKEIGVTHIFGISAWDVNSETSVRFETDVRTLRENGFDVTLFHAIPKDADYEPVGRARDALSGAPLDLHGIERSVHLERSKDLQDILEGVAATTQSSTVSFTDHFCPGRVCEYAKDGVPFYIDRHHLSFTGAEYSRAIFEREISQLRIEN